MRYASINSHKGLELSRRDDLLALGYFICYVFNGNLPWQDDVNPDSSRCRLVEKKKSKYLKSIQVKLGPPEFADYIQYCEELGFKSEPNYDLLQKLVEKVAERERIDLFDNCFDWNLIKASQKLHTHKVNDKISNSTVKSYLVPPEVGNCDNIRRDEKVVNLAKTIKFTDY